MIRRPLTTITINNDPTANISRSTRRLMGGLKNYRDSFIGPSSSTVVKQTTGKKGSATRKGIAGLHKKIRSAYAESGLSGGKSKYGDLIRRFDD